jgi:mono/diheme cytochrome c family protein
VQQLPFPVPQGKEVKRRLLWIGAAATVVTVAGTLALSAWPIAVPQKLSVTTGDPNRGAYLARASGCIACHTNVTGGGKPLAGGPPLKTKFGTFYAPNLTTDKETGIGDWTIEQFAAAVRNGVSPDGRPYYPAFPYLFYSKLSDQDIADLWTAFQTVPPVQQASNPQELTFPFNLRFGLKLWRAAFQGNEPFTPRPDKDEAWNRGAFLVRGPAHCGACHTPRNLAGARDAEFALHGAPEMPDGGKSPPITSSALKKRGWTEEALAFALRSGVMPDGDVFGGTMGEVVRDGTSFLSDGDLKAIATYLLDPENDSDVAE